MYWTQGVVMLDLNNFRYFVRIVECGGLGSGVGHAQAARQRRWLTVDFGILRLRLAAFAKTHFKFLRKIKLTRT